MRWIKKILRIIAIILPSLVFTSMFFTSSSHALKYDYDSLIIMSHEIYNSSLNKFYPLSTTWGIGYPQNNPLAKYNPPRQLVRNQFSNPCANSSTIYTPSYRTDGTGGVSYLYDNFSYYRSVDNTYPSSGYWCYDMSRTDWYEYNGIQIKPTEGAINSSGATLEDFFHRVNITTAPVYDWYKFTLPLTVRDEVLQTYTDEYGTHPAMLGNWKNYEFEGEFYSHDGFTDITPNGVQSVATSKSVQIVVQGIKPDWSGTHSLYTYTGITGTSFCTPLEISENGHRYKFSCSVQSNKTLLYPVIYITFAPSETYYPYNTSVNNYTELNKIPVFHSKSRDVFLTNWSVTTAYDPTPANVPANPDLTGSKLSNMPNYNEVNGESYFSGLTNMFNFNLLNPFAGLFSLFTGNNSCVQIPIIAGMLHANETTYCPWFDSTTRSILTPVLGLSGTMLLFGYIVRWLSSTSGNMFVDNDIKDTGHGFSLENKYNHRSKR